jgi:hypothetical protein
MSARRIESTSKSRITSIMGKVTGFMEYERLEEASSRSRSG